MKLGNVIKQMRKKSKLTQEELAEKMECSSAYICNIESNRGSISLNKLNEIAGLLGFNVKIKIEKK